ncbi:MULTISPECIES: hypothetical protein [Spirosoma]|uniref:Uncharacterized protein n=1 Tax=Spirosoma liriopis TaxID=2937440 RepID=A0ABT0HNT7_9BACT|nr:MULTISPECIES: hypothetical protein [Spirosoma]MCK8493841.1 hypothetical protein [Spirosoma liriopis]UHG93493.1 hypothetical protein LQ777_11435 [Spirosoma oryzicola]
MHNAELNGTPCPVCGHEQTWWRHCSNLCDNGYIDDASDSLLYSWVASPVPCSECRGTSIEVWCQGCGVNISGIRIPEEDFYNEKA